MTRNGLRPSAAALEIRWKDFKGNGKDRCNTPV